MNNIELEVKIKEIIGEENYFDMIQKAFDFKKEYIQSDFYKATKMPLMDVIKEARPFYKINADAIRMSIQKILNNLDFEHLRDIMDQISTTFTKENQDILSMVKDFNIDTMIENVK